jgi:hypothetical protein
LTRALHQERFGSLVESMQRAMPRPLNHDRPTATSNCTQRASNAAMVEPGTSKPTPSSGRAAVCSFIRSGLLCELRRFDNRSPGDDNARRSNQSIVLLGTFVGWRASGVRKRRWIDSNLAHIIVSHHGFKASHGKPHTDTKTSQHHSFRQPLFHCGVVLFPDHTPMSWHQEGRMARSSCGT